MEARQKQGFAIERDGRAEAASDHSAPASWSRVVVKAYDGLSAGGSGSGAVKNAMTLRAAVLSPRGLGIRSESRPVIARTRFQHLQRARLPVVRNFAVDRSGATAAGGRPGVCR